MMRFFVGVILFFCATKYALAEDHYLFTTLRCDRALELIVDGMSTQPTWLNPEEIARADGFLLGFGMLSAINAPDSAMGARGAAIGGLLAVCKDSPSRTIMELSRRFFR